jgi:hypothetical protein
MNVLDENVPRYYWQYLKTVRLPMRQVGYEVGRSGMHDDEIVPLLLSLSHPTFFTLDQDFYTPKLCHARYGLVWLDVLQVETALFVRRFLRHPMFDTVDKRMGTVVRVSHGALWVWRLKALGEAKVNW